MSGFNGKDSEFASVVTLASSLDYTPSRSSLKWLLPLASDKNSSYRDQNLLFHAGYLSREDNIITMENVFLFAGRTCSGVKRSCYSSWTIDCYCLSSFEKSCVCFILAKCSDFSSRHDGSKIV